MNPPTLFDLTPNRIAYLMQALAEKDRIIERLNRKLKKANCSRGGLIKNKKYSGNK